MKKKEERVNKMNFTHISGVTEHHKDECEQIKEIIFKLCIGEIPFTSVDKPVTLDYKNREVLLLIEGELLGSVPFEIIYFDIKRRQLEVNQYAHAIAELIREEIGKLAVVKSALV